MKFAKELEENATPEWRDKYVDYKAGKKKLKSVTRAIRETDAPSEGRNQATKSPFASLRDGPVYAFLKKSPTGQGGAGRQNGGGSDESNTPLAAGRSKSAASSPVRSPDIQRTPKAIPINERSPLQRSGGRQEGPRMTRYGSIIGSPPQEHGETAIGRVNTAPSLELPEPAVEEGQRLTESVRDEGHGSSTSVVSQDVGAQQDGFNSTQRGRGNDISQPADILPNIQTGTSNTSNKSARRVESLWQPRRVNSTPGRRPFRRRMFSMGTPIQRDGTNDDVALEAYHELEFRQAEFFNFLDKELQKVEVFYKAKEKAANDRLNVIREQLHIMRERRLEEVREAEARKKPTNGQNDGDENQNPRPNEAAFGGDSDKPAFNYERSHPLRASVQLTRAALQRFRAGHVGKTSKAMKDLGTPHGPQPQDRSMSHQDYTRKDANKAVPYRGAKRKLKIAMAEFYRGLELLKAYSLLNRTAFRKITKKYDKSTNSVEGKNYMKETVNKAYFVQSDNLDKLLQSVEDLYARYFERGNRKVSVSKLRQKVDKEGAFYGPTLRTGILLATSAVFGVQGLAYAADRLVNPTRPDEATQTSYLLQIYAGYFLMWLLVVLFCLDASIFTRYRVNYRFIFEFDVRHTLNWKELWELPAWFGLILGLCMWCNFSFWTPGVMYIYWPVILIGLSVILLCLPPPTFYWRSRSWFMESNARLLLAGVYPVEFRDFFLGDMYCSQTYALGNIELFFCLYAHHWNNPPQCNSSHSRLLGFFQAVPGIWRLLQSFRRYYDTRLWTHLANAGKYTCTILQYMSLSLWRIDKGPGTLAFFITAASLNSIYCTFWDLNYDWSLTLNLYQKPYPLLRDVLAYRRRVWWYYLAILLDPIIRCNWIFYVIFAHDAQHSSLISFFVSLSEVLRRGIWVLFRVENEHCTNVGRFRAQRDPALPYEIKRSAHAMEIAQENIEEQVDGTSSAMPTPSGRDVESGPPSARPDAASSLRRRQRQTEEVSFESPVLAAIKRAGSTFMNAHAQDYERKRRPAEAEEGKEESDEDDSDEGD